MFDTAAKIGAIIGGIAAAILLADRFIPKSGA